MDIFPIFLVVFFAAFTQSLTGFGTALVAMSILPAIVEVQFAAPLVAVMALTTESALLLRYRKALNLRQVWPLIVASLCGIPLGILALRHLNEQVFLSALGVVLVGYALYALFNFKLPELRHSFWAYLAGFLAGLLGGAYNTSGPPVVVYGNCRRWPPQEFKSNLQGFFMVNSLSVVASHAISGNLTPGVMKTYLWIVPAITLGLLAGTSLDRFLNSDVFRKVVLVLLLLMGIRLIFG